MTPYNVVLYILFHIFSHCRRVRSLETDLQYEERVTAEIENFLREQLVSNHVFVAFKGPRNRFPAWQAATTTLFDVTARQAT